MKEFFDKKVVIFIFIFIFLNQAFSQRNDELVVPNKNVFMLHLNDFILNSAVLEYERYITNYQSIRIALGYKYSTTDNFTDFKVAIFGFPKYYKVSNGGYIGVSYKFIIKPRTTFFNMYNEFYIMPSIYYSNTSFDNKLFYRCTGMEMETFVKTQSMTMEKTGVKILFGDRYYLNDNDDVKVNTFLEIYAGIGCQKYRDEIFTFNKKVGTCDIDDDNYQLDVYDPPLREVSNKYRLTLHLGIILGFDF